MGNYGLEGGTIISLKPVGLKFIMNHPYKSVSKKLLTRRFDILSGCNFIEGNSLKKGKKGKNGGNFPQ